MERDELMIGNHVLINGALKKVTLEVLNVLGNIEGIMPIKLSVVYMVALGFDTVPNKSEKVIFYYKGIHFILDEGKCTTDLDTPTSFEYVHELQNFIFALYKQKISIC